MAFSATEAALEGFKITRARPSAALVWAGVQLVLAFVDRLAAILIAGPRLNVLIATNPLSVIAHPEQLQSAMGLISEIGAASIVLHVIAGGFLFAAANRSVLEPSRGGPGWLAAGMDELRQMGVLALYVLVLFAAYIGGTMVASAAFGLVLVPLLGNLGMGLTVMLSVLADLAFVVWVGVRLSLAPPATFAERRIVFFDTWRLTRRRFWPLLGAYLTSWLLAALVLILVMGIGSVAIWLMSAGAPDPASMQMNDLASLFSPESLVLIVFGAVANGLASLILLTPPPYAWREVSAAPQPPAVP